MNLINNKLEQLLQQLDRQSQWEALVKWVAVLLDKQSQWVDLVIKAWVAELLDRQ